MLYKKMIVVCTEIHTKHKYAVWAERSILYIKPGGLAMRIQPVIYTGSEQPTIVILSVSRNVTMFMNAVTFS
jgi:hypothetical protein